MFLPIEVPVANILDAHHQAYPNLIFYCLQYVGSFDKNLVKSLLKPSTWFVSCGWWSSDSDSSFMNSFFLCTRSIPFPPFLSLTLVLTSCTTHNIGCVQPAPLAQPFWIPQRCNHQSKDGEYNSFVASSIWHQCLCILSDLYWPSMTEGRSVSHKSGHGELFVGFVVDWGVLHR